MAGPTAGAVDREATEPADLALAGAALMEAAGSGTSISTAGASHRSSEVFTSLEQVLLQAHPPACQQERLVPQ